MRKLLILYLIIFSSIFSTSFAQEIGESGKIESAIINCLNCDTCPDGRKVGSGEICVYLFWGQGCPHCAEEKIFLEELKGKYPQLKVFEFEVYHNQENLKLWQDVCKRYDTQPVGVPMTFIGNKAFIGFKRTADINTQNNTQNSFNIQLTILLFSVVIVSVLFFFFHKRFKIKVRV